jgi:hypothetical protein
VVAGKGLKIHVRRKRCFFGGDSCHLLLNIPHHPFFYAIFYYLKKTNAKRKRFNPVTGFSLGAIVRLMNGILTAGWKSDHG